MVPGRLCVRPYIAVVGDSKLEKVLVEPDCKLFGKKKEDLIENCFDVADIDKAWERA